jgi:hypothetical protein
MIQRTELITLGSSDLLALLGARRPGEPNGSIVLVSNGESKDEVDLEDLCLVLRVETAASVQKPHVRSVIPMKCHDHP